jgi:Xaa-Pro aminopeptidase
MKTRVESLMSLCGKNSAFYISGASDIFYLSGFSGTFAKIIMNKKNAFFMTDPRYAGAAQKLKIDSAFRVIVTRDPKQDTKKLLSGFDTILLDRNTGLQEYLFLKTMGKTLKFDDRLASMRMIKNAAEISLIKKAVSINEAGIRRVASILKPGVSEKDLALEFEYHTRKLGADSVSFPPIIAFNANSAVPHHATSAARLRKNTFILIDSGVKYRGYCSDLTRCVCFGIIEPRLKGIQKQYNIVRNARAAAVSAYKNGSLIRQADAKTRLFLRKNGLAARFTHSLGHGIGIDVHEPPFVNAREKIRFTPGMVATCEPGVYFEGRYGIRIEDDYLITRSGPEKLGRLSDALMIQE